MQQVRDMSDVFLEYGKTSFHPSAALFMLVSALMILAGRRSRAVFWILAVMIFMPAMQRIVVGGLDFAMLRIALMFGWLRVFLRGEHRAFQRSRIDGYFLVWLGLLATAHVLRVGSSAIIYRLGFSYDAIATFYFFRCMVRNENDVRGMVRQLAWLCVALGPFMLYEWLTLNNVFSVYGSAPPISSIRDGKVRCQGPFSHPILTGTFAGVVFPLFVGLFWKDKKHRTLLLLAILFSAIITRSSGSSGPIIAWGVGLLGWALWPIRRHMPLIGSIALVMALFIHIIREKPIWHLIGRLASVTGGTGYHRFRLIDAFVEHFEEWALVGTDGTAHWGWGLQDTTNQYVAEGINGGLLTLIAFLLLLRVAFVMLRAGRRASEATDGPKGSHPLLLWGASASLASHCVSFISVSYFGQIQQFFVAFLAVIPAATVAAQGLPPKQRVRIAARRRRRPLGQRRTA